MPVGCLELGDAEKDEQGDMKYEMEKNDCSEHIALLYSGFLLLYILSV